MTPQTFSDSLLNSRFSFKVCRAEKERPKERDRLGTTGGNQKARLKTGVGNQRARLGTDVRNQRHAGNQFGKPVRRTMHPSTDKELKWHHWTANVDINCQF